MASSLSLPVRRRDQLRRVLSGQSIEEASAAVGYSTIGSGYQALSDTRKRCLAAMDHYQLTPVTFVRDYLLPLLNATETKFATFEGKITDSVEVSDNTTRMDAARMTAKIMDLFPKSANVNVATKINITIGPGKNEDED